MAELSTLARPYAKAAFEYARDADALPAWETMLQLATAVCRQHKVAAVLTSPAYTTSQQAEIFIGLCGEELTKTFANLMQGLARNKRLPLLPQISEQFSAMKAERDRTVDVELITAFELNSIEMEILAKSLSNKLERTVKMQARVDASLLGGVIIRAGDMVIDGSARGRLVKLGEAINH